MFPLQSNICNKNLTDGNDHQNSGYPKCEGVAALFVEAVHLLSQNRSDHRRDETAGVDRKVEHGEEHRQLQFL